MKVIPGAKQNSTSVVNSWATLLDYGLLPEFVRKGGFRVESGEKNYNRNLSVDYLVFVGFDDSHRHFSYVRDPHKLRGVNGKSTWDIRHVVKPLSLMQFQSNRFLIVFRKESGIVWHAACFTDNKCEHGGWSSYTKQILHELSWLLDVSALKRSLAKDHAKWHIGTQIQVNIVFSYPSLHQHTLITHNESAGKPIISDKMYCWR